MLKSRTSRWSIATAGLCLIILVATWLVLISPRRSDAAARQEENASAQEQNDQLQVRIEQLKAQYADLPARRAELAAVLAQLPQEAQVPTLLRQLSQKAVASGLEIDGVTPGAATRSTATTATVPSSTSSSGGSSASRTTSTGSMTLVDIPLTIIVRGDYFQTVAFLQQLQTQMKRALLLTGIDAHADQQSSGAGSGRLQVTVTGDLFVLSNAAAAATSTAGGSSGTTPGAGSAGGAQTAGGNQ